MGFIDSLKHPLPHFMESRPPPFRNNGAGTTIPEYREKPYFIVASVEMGNTTTKCVLTGTNLETGATYIINKTVMFTRDARLPKEGEEVIATSLVGHPVSMEGVAEIARDVLKQCHEEAGLSIEHDLDFVVRSTGMAATWHSPQEVAGFIGAIATGCVQAGVHPRKMTPPMSREHLPKKLQPFSLMDKVTLRETVAGVIPPSDLAGEDRLVANEMEGVLAMAGIKDGALLSPIDFRNPCIAMDFGTTVDGCITGDVPHDHKTPFARTIGTILGLGGAVPDALARGTPDVDDDNGTALDLLGDEFVPTVLTLRERSVVKEYTDEVHDLLTIGVVPEGATHFGTVPVDPKGATEQGITLIGCDCGTNFSDAPRLKAIGADIYEKHGAKKMAEVIDRVCARMALRFIDVAVEERLLLPEKTAIGFSGRAATSGRKPEYIFMDIKDRSLYTTPYDHVIFVEDALARGASLMARCMCSLGRPQNPIGGCRGGPCILGLRKKAER
ncbi:methanogenesis marker 14 protein [Methanofollis aquaemaris]|uniref:Methanogenesis marker 14 protein n=1 Tax=Methanofollis aquaemaris TaxID=126734 RepID=A0A8A3S7G0_9EURY|nr:methanogenesis marker 14 protein [Methanofollis aquaemaris]QSZ67799.1 methanogenesis marker 14 protein [Methanofollis aquaemaris]